MAKNGSSILGQKLFYNSCAVRGRIVARPALARLRFLWIKRVDSSDQPNHNLDTELSIHLDSFPKKHILQEKSHIFDSHLRSCIR